MNIKCLYSLSKTALLIVCLFATVVSFAQSTSFPYTDDPILSSSSLGSESNGVVNQYCEWQKMMAMINEFEAAIATETGLSSAATTYVSKSVSGTMVYLTYDCSELIQNIQALQSDHSTALLPPTMAISAAEVSSGATSNDGTLTLTFTANKATGDFVVDDITVTNGAISGFTAVSSNIYTGTFTPAGDGTCAFDVEPSAFTDPSGDGNTVSNSFTWTYDSTPPTMTITAAEVLNGATSNDAALTLTFTSSESTTDFEQTDITVTNGTLATTFAGSGTTYTATFTPTGDGECTIDVAGSNFTDAAGTNNTAADQFNWTKETAAAAFVDCGDPYTFDGHPYATVLIGTQCWFAENLRTTVYDDGSAIEEVTGTSEWAGLSTGARCDYDNNPANVATYGRLYNWHAVNAVNGLCPSGWHVPTGLHIPAESEYTTLIEGLGGLQVAGGKMKSSVSDSPAWDGTNESGFSGLAGGWRTYQGNFVSVGAAGYFWSASGLSTDSAWYRRLSSGTNAATKTGAHAVAGQSVRCVLD